MTVNDMGFDTAPKGSFTPIEPGTYDFVIHGIVGLGLRKPFFDVDDNGKKVLPKVAVKIIFELPSNVRDDGQTEVTAMSCNMSTHGKSQLFKVFHACLGDAVIASYDKNGTPIMDIERVSATGLKVLLGSVGALTIVNKKSEKGQIYARVSAVNYLDPRLPRPVATREQFFFSPFQPDLEVFKNNLSYWTQKDVMSSLNADTFPKELHDAWVKIEEDRASADANKNDSQSDDTSSIE
ncbi:hypothetical protein UFOVP1_32 [uncultured Caudovirales phage]|uniref:Uncharacterized protein n=1 Tax=uncultured Caudovirales phage TaxID=2100421 RepID=A0A6J5KHA6_9CAUD|nr:hypothetical protein UFOVP1_32 [uncultured Caudovirales phage]